MKAATTLRLVVWGLGRHGVGKILPAVAEASGVELYGVCSRNATSVRTYAELWKCQGWTEPASMLRDSNVDIVYVATPIALHAEHGKLVLAAGKHLWCEKPLTSSLAQTLALVEASRSQRLSLCEGHMYLHHPQFRQLSAYLSEGRLGAVKSVECRFGIPRLEDPGFRSDPALGGGALFDVGCYPISAINALFPDATPHIASSRVCSRGGSGIDTDGYAAIELSNDALAVLEWRRNSAYRSEIDIWGDNGSLFTDKIFSKNPTYVPVFHFRDAHGKETTEDGQAGDHFLSMLNDFREMIDDPVAAEAERRRINWSAEVVEQIWAAAGHR
jgi:predicted dehydrogenase